MPLSDAALRPVLLPLMSLIAIQKPVDVVVVVKAMRIYPDRSARTEDTDIDALIAADIEELERPIVPEYEHAGPATCVERGDDVLSKFRKTLDAPTHEPLGFCRNLVDASCTDQLDPRASCG